MYYEQYPAVTYIVVASCILTILLGAFGNLVVLRAYFQVELGRNKPFDVILANSVFSDLLMCLVFTPLLLLYRANPSAAWIEKCPLCEIGVLTSMTAISVQYLVFALFSLNRKDVTLRPHSLWLNESRCKNLLIAAWMISVAISVVLVGLLRLTVTTEVAPRLYRCLIVNRDIDAYSVYFLCLSSFVFVVGIGVGIHSYARIYCPSTMREEADLTTTADDARKTRMCVVVVVVYTLCWTPFLLVQLFGIFGDYSETLFNCHALASAAGVMSSAVNPYLYSYADEYYWKKFMHIFNSRRLTLGGID